MVTTYPKANFIANYEAAKLSKKWRCILPYWICSSRIRCKDITINISITYDVKRCR